MRKYIRDTYEKVIEGVLATSGLVTTLTLLLIVIFLFREGFSLFNTSPVENKNLISVNAKNPVSNVNADQLRKIFDQETTNWKVLGGANDSIILFDINQITDYYGEEQLGSNFENMPALIDHLIDSIPGMIAVYPEKYHLKEAKSKTLNVAKNNIPDFFTGKIWLPTAEPASQLGILPLLLGTILVSIFAIVIALPIGLATAIYMAEVADEKVRNIIKPVIELLAGIPSVVYGFFGLIVIVPLIQKTFNLSVGETALAGSVVLGIMALPTIITVSEDAIRTCPRSMREASLALGANRWQTISRVVLPYSASGISAAAILGIARAMGETMAVLMVTGNAAVIPHTLLEPVRTIPATIAAELGEAPQGGVHFKALFALGCILFLLTMIINFIVEYISNRRKLIK